MKKIIKYCLVVICIVILIPIFNNNVRLSADGFSDNFTELMKSQENAKEAYEKLAATFNVDKYNTEYPDEYAGVYIEDNKLIIRLVGNDEDKKKEYLDLLRDYNCIEIIDAVYSLNYLNELAVKLEAQIEELSPTSYYVDPISNSLVINVPTENLDKAYSEFNAGILQKNSKQNPITIVEDNDYMKAEAASSTDGD